MKTELSIYIGDQSRNVKIKYHFHAGSRGSIVEPPEEPWVEVTSIQVKHPRLGYVDVKRYRGLVDEQEIEHRLEEGYEEERYFESEERKELDFQSAMDRALY